MKMTFIGSPSTLKTCITDLAEWKIIEVLQWGKNDWTGATKVRFTCSFLNRYCTATVPLHSNEPTADGAAIAEMQLQGNGKMTLKPKKKKASEADKAKSASEFDQFWDLYGKKVGKVNAFKEWNKLSKEDQQKAIEGIGRYKKKTPNSQFRKDPERYLNPKQRYWESDFETVANIPPAQANVASTPRPTPQFDIR